MTLSPFVLSVLAPPLIQAMGWSRADFAMTGMVSGLAIFSYSVIGRMADKFGTRRATGIGVAAATLSFALDRFQPEWVGAITLSLPAIGMFFLASPLDQPLTPAAAVLLIGLGTGAEGDLLAYLVVRYLGLEVYSIALGLLFASVGVTAMFGSIALSASLRLAGGYAAFLIAAGVAVVGGCLLLLRLTERTPTTEMSWPECEMPESLRKALNAGPRRSGRRGRG